MKLRDRLRRWWSPAQWADDHPLEANKERSARKKHHRTVMYDALDDFGAPVSPDRDFKKPSP